MKQKSSTADFVIALGALLIGIAIYVLSMGLMSAKLGLGAGGFPKVVACGFMILGGSQLIIVLKRGVDFKMGEFDLKKSLPTILAVVFAMLYVLLVPTIGFAILTPILMFALMFLFGLRAYVKGAVISIIFSTVVYLLFTKVFLIFLPQGILPF